MRNLKLFLIKLLFNDIYSEQQQLIKDQGGIIRRQRLIIEIFELTVKDVIEKLDKVYMLSEEVHSMTGASER